MHKHFIHILTKKTKSVLVARVVKTRRIVVTKYVDNLMFCSEKSNETFRLQECLQTSILPRVPPCVSTKLKMKINHKSGFKFQ